MRIFITGVSCVGKTTVGSIVASRLGVRFFDLDEEVERFSGCSIGRLQSKFLTIHSFRDEAAKALTDILSRPESRNCVIALPPSGLMGAYLRVVRKAEGITVVLVDRPENILKRITFYDLESRPIETRLSEKEKLLYLREIKKDITYFRKSYDRSDLKVDVSDLSPEQAADRIVQALNTASRSQPASADGTQRPATVPERSSEHPKGSCLVSCLPKGQEHS